MAEIVLHNRKVETVFDLLGTKEDDISYSLAWCMKSSHTLLKLIIETITEKKLNEDELKQTRILLQSHEKDKGRTDFEIILPIEFAIIIEAKKGWLLPDEVQLKKYSERKTFVGVKDRFIISLSECKDYYADNFLVKEVNGISVKHLSFSKINQLLKEARAKTNGLHEKGIIEQFSVYLNKIYRMQKLDSNYVYVVSLGTGAPQNWKISWIDIAIKKGKYFHPVGNTWPQEPPNYIAFRYFGQLQSIHHIRSYQVTRKLSTIFPEEAPEMNEHEPHFVYELGPAIKPVQQVRTGSKIVRNRRVWCMLDTLLTHETISDAHDESKRRWEIIQQQ